MSHGLVGHGAFNLNNSGGKRKLGEGEPNSHRTNWVPCGILDIERDTQRQEIGAGKSTSSSRNCRLDL